jgi:DNA-binding NarL/FixJ family response regulator
LTVADALKAFANGNTDEHVMLFTPECWSRLQQRFRLSCRQTQICKLVCEGYANKQIAGELGVTLDTIRMHLKEVFRKMEVRTRVDLVVSLVIAQREEADTGARV